jgi:tyrosyl-tRNA synthetase
MAILPGTDGVVKMSKSLGNHIPLNSNPEDMYGKVMSVPDAAMPQYAKLVTRWLPAEVHAFENDLKSGALHPRDAKMRLAHEITATYYSEDAATGAQEAFVRQFQQGQIPTDMPEYASSPARPPSMC